MHIVRIDPTGDKDMVPSPYLNDPKVYIDTDTFIDLVSERTRCLICCEPLNGKVANREHVLPKWILRKYDLYDKEITLPHDYKARQYGGHTMPCCKDCNSLLGKKLEQPVRQLTQGGYAKLQRRLDENGQRLLFTWLSWVFLKFLIKDGAIPINPDQRVQAVMQDKDTDWTTLHHIHCLARSPYTGAHLSPEVLGSVVILAIDDDRYREDFDLITVHETQTIMVRLGDLAIIANLSDSGRSMDIVHRFVLPARQERFTVLQALEICADMAVTTTRIENKPVYFTRIDRATGHPSIHADLPVYEANPVDPDTRAAIFELVYREHLPHLKIAGSDMSALQAIRENRLTFLEHRISRATGEIRE
ncbi:hypothetical protein FHT77_001599 [Rhizobium sp. BK181]|uniref:hypothetical protein n=1 Tax=Rhizobium sp. BK181 TaxID=2587072 RepID=UPI00181B94C7|nr:hypothetical protein [Rhizobium sp. BK181]MBB3315734.1 hypothetical protein [Rhizobium sp. BK181]